MERDFENEFIETPINWVGKSGNKYPILKPTFKEPFPFINHGNGGVMEFKGMPHEARGFYNDLPKNDYPYTIEYKKEHKFACYRTPNETI
jgi:hypothetical protein